MVDARLQRTLVFLLLQSLSQRAGRAIRRIDAQDLKQFAVGRGQIVRLKQFLCPGEKFFGIRPL